ncbi:MAG: HD domain-containing protein [Desulfurivibrio sp.]|nr:HD domain-containing protein [Desulfurivibrio sp.]
MTKQPTTLNTPASRDYTARAAIHYLIALIVIPLYGINVCPFVESLAPWQVALPVALALALQYGLRAPLYRRLIATLPLAHRVGRTFWLELLLFVATALALMVYNHLFHGFPLVSGLKVLVGVVGLGFYAAVDLALSEELRVATLVEEGHGRVTLDSQPFSMVRKVRVFATVSLLLLIAVMMLLVIKDLDWLVDATVPITEARGTIIREFLFVLAVILPHTLNIIHSYARNLRRILNSQTGVMGRVSSGDYAARVPVASNDEFGLIAGHTNEMVDRILARSEELAKTRDVTILTLASLAETRDNETGAHILRTQHYIQVLADHLRDDPDFADELSAEHIDLIFKSAPLHDIGKVGIPDAILLKPDKLSAEEFTVMKTHAQLGADALAVAEQRLGNNSFLRYAREIALNHHEKWDGSGYPQGLREREIPLAGRLMAVADVYDALISKRVYKPAFPHQKAMEIIQEGAGHHFDPKVVAALVATEEQFRTIAARYHDAYRGAGG